MSTIRMVTAAMLLLFASAVHAQQQVITDGAHRLPPTAQAPGDPLSDSFFPPELVMSHQQEIGLTDEQRSYIIAQVDTAQQRATTLQWKLQREVETMVTLVKQEPIDEDKILAQLDRVLAAERDIKRIHLTLVMRIRKDLTPQQRARLQAMRSGAGG